MRIFIVLVKRGPEEGPDNTGAFNGTEGQAESPHHVLIALMGQGDVAGRKSVCMLGFLLKSDTGKSVSLLPGEAADGLLDINREDLHQPQAANELDTFLELGRRKGTLRRIHLSAGMFRE